MLKTLTAAFVMTAVFMGGSSAVAAADPQPNQAQPNKSYNITVQAGDSLSALATANHTTYTRLFDANSNISDPDLIYPGEVVRVPAANEQLPNRPLPGSQAAPQPPAAQPEADVTAEPEVSTSSTSTILASYTGTSSVWTAIAQCESGGNWGADTGNGFYGGLQFTLSSWQAVGGTGYPNDASPAEQIARAQMLEASQGWSAWPVCAAEAGV